MLHKYETNFSNLDERQASYLADAVSTRYQIPVDPRNIFSSCEQAGLDQADVVLSLSNDATVFGIGVIETLVGKPIVRPQNKKTAPRAKKPRVKGAAVQRDDTRIVTNIVPNPKRPGSASHARFEMYRDGLTVSETVAQEGGPTMADIKWDSGRGFITLQSKKDQ